MMKTLEEEEERAYATERRKKRRKQKNTAPATKGSSQAAANPLDLMQNTSFCSRNMSEESDSGENKQIKELPKSKPKPEEARRPSVFSKPIEESETESRGKETLKPPHRVYYPSFGSDDGRKLSEPRRAPEEKPEKPGKERQRRPSAFESVLHALRRPSLATLDVFSNLRRGSGTSKGSHTTIDSSRRPSHLEAAHSQNSRSETSLLLQKFPPRNSSITQNQIIIRRPSGAITFNPDQMSVHQKRYIMGLLHGSNNSLPELCRDVSENSPKKKHKQKPCSDGNDSYISAMSALYANLLCVLGIAFPVTEVLSPHVPTHFYQAYYLYLYMGSLAFMTFMYVTLLKDRAVFKIIQSSLDVEEDEVHRMRTKRKSQQLILSPVRYGSFYLRLGAVAFGVGSMVYSGLEFGQYFELKQDTNCHNLIQAATPVTRMILTLVQMQFIFLSSRQMEMSKYRGVSKFGLMHMIATNLCEWLNVIVEETKHEIIHLRHLDESATEEVEKHGLGKREADVHDIFECRRANVMGSLVQDASPFLFPCTIEYSLICAVILYEMWKDIKKVPKFEDEDTNKTRVLDRELSAGSDIHKSNHLFSVDCSNAHKGLFSGILVLVMTIISLIMFFVMTKDPNYRHLAVYEVNVCELVLYCITTLTVVAGSWQMRYFKYKLNNRLRGIGLDNTLLMWAQSGTYIYCMFSIIACYFMIDHNAPGGFITEMCSLIQTTCQTAFILDATFRRTDTAEQHKRKPGRQIVTFLLVGNMTLWLLNTLQKNRAEFRPTHLEFYGVWAWTIITHVSMPLAIFYRFHSTICLFEIWKDVYKFKQEQQHHV